jgi:2-methylcitrate dehydratase PrpD
MLTSRLTDCILSIRYDKLPDEVIGKAKDCFTDFLGVALRGSETKSGQIINSLILEGDESTVFSTETSTGLNDNPFKTNARDAGLANGVFAHSLDLDDGHRMAQLHPGACVIPAALAQCESHNRSGKHLIESIVAGYQVAIVLGMLINPEHRNHGFHSTGTCGTLGAAAAASKALDLNKNEIINALGLAGTMAAGLLESDHSGSMGKHLHAGKSAQSGVLAAQLAEKGFTGAETILEGHEGLIKSMAGINPGKVNIEDLMDKYRILEVYFKIYPVCRHLHPSIDAILEIVSEHSIRPDDAKKITVNTYQTAADHDNYHPKNTESIRQSLPVSLSLALINLNNKHDILKNFEYPPEDRELKREIQELSQKIVIKKDDHLDRKYPSYRPSKVSILTNKGLNEKQVDLPRGEPEKPLSKDDLNWKFKNLNPKLDMKVINIIQNIDSYSDVNHFTADLNSFL